MVDGDFRAQVSGRIHQLAGTLSMRAGIVEVLVNQVEDLCTKPLPQSQTKALAARLIQDNRNDATKAQDPTA